VDPAPVLTNNEETEIVKWMMYCSQRGFPVTKSQLLTNVQLLIKKLARDTPFKDGRPGRHWVRILFKTTSRNYIKNFTKSDIIEHP